MSRRRPDPRELAREHNRNGESGPTRRDLRRAERASRPTGSLTIFNPDGTTTVVPAGPAWPGFRTWPYDLTPEQVRAEHARMMEAMLCGPT